MNRVTVVKLAPGGAEFIRYEGEVIFRDEHSLTLLAHFGLPDKPFHDVLLRRGDPFVEIYYTDRWYNVYQIHDRDSLEIKAWYCNVSHPAVITQGEVRFIDLALDLLVYPDGRQLTLDEDEFAALEIDEAARAQARQGLEELKKLVKPGEGYRLAWPDERR